ncbi:hypothetical protein [Nocardia mangyaensis]|uniref:hypothetical protein n=1 Tax=Nocardia mangyaensis TaxID=2213200 RepID=UPI0026760E2F|nr:hypothetical protein [Nocardia mangyaensis]MDO3648973.1 hypothetical protein [Nocardia mangyaensis]
MTITDEQRIRTLVLDPDLGPVELHAGAATTVTSVFGNNESSPWRASRPHED